jgi:uncharacterized protein (TIGR00725 family)
MMKTLIAVIGSADADKTAMELAFETGREIIREGFSLLCGGLSGVMEAASRGALSEAGENSGRIIGILPGTSKSDANPFIDIAIPTGVGYARNTIIACASDAVIAIAGGSGTLSEIAMAWQYGKPIVVIEEIEGVSNTLAGSSLDNRRKDRILGARDGREAVALIKRMLGQ